MSLLSNDCLSLVVFGHINRYPFFKLRAKLTNYLYINYNEYNL